MIYVSIDIETSGLDPEKNCILSFGAIIEDTNKKLPYDEIPKFYKIINQREIVGRPFALNMNKKVIENIGIYQEGKPSEELKNMMIEEDDLAKEFYTFLFKNNAVEFVNDKLVWEDLHTNPVFNKNTKVIRFNVAGKNYGTFDKLFLEKIFWWKRLFIPRHKIFDPAILYVNWEEDNQLPSLDDCKERAGIDGVVTHNALEDAWDVVELLRKQY